MLNLVWQVIVIISTKDIANPLFKGNSEELISTLFPVGLFVGFVFIWAKILQIKYLMEKVVVEII
jgi:hypothetical protein